MAKKLNKGCFGSYDMPCCISFDTTQVSFEILVEKKDIAVFFIVDSVNYGLRRNIRTWHFRPILEVFVGEEFGNTVGQTFGLRDLIDYVTIILWI